MDLGHQSGYNEEAPEVNSCYKTSLDETIDISNEWESPNLFFLQPNMKLLVWRTELEWCPKILELFCALEPQSKNSLYVSERSTSHLVLGLHIHPASIDGISLDPS